MDILSDLLDTADTAESLPASVLRRRLDDLSAFLTDRVLPVTPDKELNRLVDKLGALRERLVHSYFGPPEIGLLRRTLYELEGRLRLLMGTAEAIPA